MWRVSAVPTLVRTPWCALAGPRSAARRAGRLEEEESMSSQEALMTDAGAHTAGYPTLAEMIAAHSVPPARIVLVAHVLDTAVPFVRALAGAMPVAAVIAVPYSARADACAQLAEDLTVCVPAGTAEVGTQALRYAAAATRGGAERVVIVEVGGYCAHLVDRLADTPGVRGIVEDTKQGHWRYEQRQPLLLPVFTIADSPLKALENSQVGRSIAYSVDHLLRTRFFRLVSEARVGVLGYGGVGTATARYLRDHGARVGVYDADQIRMSQAVIDGHEPFARAELLRWADVIVGVSGHRSVTADDLDLLRDGAVLASGSSKQVEFDVPGIRRRTELKRERDEVAELGVAGRTIFLLNDGRPVNFLHQSILGNVLDLVYSELYLCTRELGRRPCPPGLHRLDPGLQQDLARRWIHHHGRGGWRE
jgi:adenosylhomocysteinase